LLKNKKDCADVYCVTLIEERVGYIISSWTYPYWCVYSARCGVRLY